MAVENDEVLRKYAKDRLEVYGEELQGNEEQAGMSKSETACAAKIVVKVVTPDSDAVRDEEY